MVFRSKKRVIFDFLPYEYKSLEEYLEKMAAKGWILENINGQWLKFNKSEPKKLKYSFDIMNKVSFLDGKNSDESLEYREYCEKVGWKFVCESDRREIYCSELDEDRIEIHTDEIEKFNIMAKASLKYISLKIITLICVLITPFMITIGGSDAHFLANTLTLSCLILASAFLLQEMISIISFLIFFIKGKISIKNREKINYNFKVSILLKRLVRYLFLIFLILILTALIIDYNTNILKILFIIIGLSFISEYIVNFIRNMNYKNKRVIILSYYFILIIVMISVITNFVFVDIFNKDNKYYNEKIEKVPQIKIEDFNDSNKDDLIFFRKDKSPIASYLFYSNEGENIYLSYDIFESNYKWAVKYNFEKKMKFVNKIGIKYIEKETNLPNDIKVYMNEHGHQYIIVSENKMVEIFTIEGISENQLINTVYEEVFKTK